MKDAVVAIVLALAATWTGVVALMAQALVRNQDQDSYLTWRRSLGPLFRVGHGPRSLAFSERITRYVTLALFAGSGLFALRALISG